MVDGVREGVGVKEGVFEKEKPGDMEGEMNCRQSTMVTTPEMPVAPAAVACVPAYASVAEERTAEVLT